MYTHANEVFKYPGQVYTNYAHYIPLLIIIYFCSPTVSIGIRARRANYRRTGDII